MDTGVSELVNELLTEEGQQNLTGNDAIPQKRGRGRPPKTPAEPQRLIGNAMYQAIPSSASAPRKEGMKSSPPNKFSTIVRRPQTQDSDSEDTDGDDQFVPGNRIFGNNLGIRERDGKPNNSNENTEKTSLLAVTSVRQKRAAATVPVFYGDEKDEYEEYDEKREREAKETFEDSTTGAPPKKRRGRPPKRKSNDDENDSDPEVVPKRRGRPRKQRDSEANEDSDNSSAPKKRRGRPRKVQSLQEKEDSDDEQVDEGDVEVGDDDPSTGAKPPPRRTRPAGAPPQVWDDKHISVGIRVSAYFECSPDDVEAQIMPSMRNKDILLPMKLFNGRVTSYSYAKKLPLYHVVWEDGDEEDYDVHELLQGVLKYQNRYLPADMTSSSSVGAFL